LETPTTPKARVLSIKGAPRIAPMPTSWAFPPGPNKMAITGTIVSGIAVPTAARTLPTAPSERFSLFPSHSIPLVKILAPARIVSKPAARISRSRNNLINLRIEFKYF
jgi:hypothetical protein